MYKSKCIDLTNLYCTYYVSNHTNDKDLLKKCMGSKILSAVCF